MRKFTWVETEVGGPQQLELALPELVGFAADPTEGTPSSGAPATIDLTEATTAGRLNWSVPPGSWTVTRIGQLKTGKQNHPAHQHRPRS